LEVLAHEGELHGSGDDHGQSPLPHGGGAADGPLLLSRLAIGIALVTFGLSCSLIADDSRNHVVSPLPRFCLGSGCNVGCFLVFGSLGLDALLLLLPRQFLELYTIPLVVPLFPGRGYRQTLRLPCKAGRFCGVLSGLVAAKKSGFGVGSRRAAVGKIVFFGVSQVCVL
jgi:hypothetical protein